MEQDVQLAPFRICTYLALVFNCPPEVVLPIYISCPPLSMRDMFSHFKFELAKGLKKYQQNPDNEELVCEITSRVIKTSYVDDFIDQHHRNMTVTEEEDEEEIWELTCHHGHTHIKFNGLRTYTLNVSVKTRSKTTKFGFWFNPLEMIWTAGNSRFEDFDMGSAFNLLLQDTGF